MASALLIKKLREALSHVGKTDHRLFLDIARNTPGSGAPIVNAVRNGFIDLSAVLGSAGEKSILTEHTKAAKRYRSRETMFGDIVSTVHKLAPSFHVYLGRTYFRVGYEHLGPRARFNHHWSKRDMEYGRVFAKVSRESIIADEELAIALVNFWDSVGALCCNNTCMLSSGSLSKDETQLIYLCVREKTAKEKKDYKKSRDIDPDELLRDD